MHRDKYSRRKPMMILIMCAGICDLHQTPKQACPEVPGSAAEHLLCNHAGESALGRDRRLSAEPAWNLQALAIP